MTTPEVYAAHVSIPASGNSRKDTEAIGQKAESLRLFCFNVMNLGRSEDMVESDTKARRPAMRNIRFWFIYLFAYTFLYFISLLTLFICLFILVEPTFFYLLVLVAQWRHTVVP